ncbi:MAG TPA: AAA family ATPase [Acetobacteraceae bacterium]|jgi:aminoglycoside phosphotransferase family enzyme/predicted kinase|nr:AAA family ATPase [Acetobacteraceae bacterium]
MAVPPEQAETAALLRRLAGADPVETHISLVYVGADTVWKLKKAVRLPFLDFSRVDDRRRFVLRELDLNGPAAPGLYRDVVPVVRGPDGSLSLGGAGLPAVDWVLRMARVPADDFLDVRARAGRFTPALLDSLGDAVAEYHGALAPIAGVAVADTMRWIAKGNVRSAHDAGLAEEPVRAWFADESAALTDIDAWERKRARDGFVRRTHGDLHLGNLCLWRGKPVPFDALEFDERMATIDLGYDLAFLLMDIDQRVDRRAANRVLNRYVARTGDAALTRGLPAFLSMRAMVRAHVEASRSHAVEAERYQREAAHYLHPPPPILLAIGGLPGSGKSTLARALAPELGGAPGALVLRSDEIRKRLHGAAPEDRLPQTAYSDAASTAVFATLAQMAGEAAVGGHAVIADATFIDPRHRVMLHDAAEAPGVPFLGLWLEAPLPVLEARISGRQHDASDATVDVLHAASQANPQAGDWVAVDAGDAAVALEQARAAVRQRLGIRSLA